MEDNNSFIISKDNIFASFDMSLDDGLELEFSNGYVTTAGGLKTLTPRIILRGNKGAYEVIIRLSLFNNTKLL